MKILVATPDFTFGELLRASLAENGDYNVHLVQTGSEVLSCAASTLYALAILDAHISDEPFIPLARSLQALTPNLRLMVIPPENNPRHPALIGISPHGYIYQPFYLPDLLETVSSLLASRTTRGPDERMDPLFVESAIQHEGLNWAEDASQAEQQLTRQLLQTSAQAALITYQGKVWASAGKLGHTAVQEAADRLASCWEEGRKLDLARFVRLEATNGEHLIYTTRLLDEIALALIFEGSASLTRAHAQIAHMASALDHLVTAPLNELIAEAPKIAADAEEERLAKTDAAEELFSDESPQIDLSVLLAGMPSPDPDGNPLFPQTEWVHEIGEEDPSLFPWEKPSPSDPEKPLPSDQPGSEDNDLPEWLSVLRSNLEQDPSSASELQPVQANAVPTPAESAMEEQRTTRDPISDLRAESFQPHASSDPLERPVLAIGEQAYTIIMLPALPEHYLRGEIAEHLSMWFPQVCLAFGWRLEGLSIRPEYIQFTMLLTPSVSPSMVVRILRQRTSERIFNRFIELQSQDAQSDFWAPGHLVVRDSQPPSTHLLRDFIQQTRSRQGF
jgi:DNA-binding response OmpR family regulator/REP element-mobilizing transposase RayT